MRTKILIFLLLSASLLKAQNTSDLPLEIRLMGGFNNSYLFFEDTKMRPSVRPNLGFTLKREIGKKLSLNADLLYSSREAKYKSYKFRRNGAELNLYTSYHIQDFNLIAGFQLYSYDQLDSINSVNESVAISSTKQELTEQLFQPFFGFGIKLNETTDLSIIQTLPLSKHEEYNLQFRIAYNLSPIKREKSFRKQKVEASKNQIQELKNGVLLIRLRNSEVSFNALRNRDKTKKAEKLERLQFEENLNVIKAFRKEFDFTEVHFFSSENSIKVKQKEWGNIFLSDDLKSTYTFNPQEDQPIYIAELTELQQDTNRWLNGYDHTYSSQEPFKSMYEGGSEISFKAFVIKDANFNELMRPFPYYVRFIIPSIKQHPEQLLAVGVPLLLLSPLSYEECVRKWNAKLHRYYLKTTLVETTE